ncbi:Hpt domain-containing protein, partial [Bradyrhizobium sp. NBAIM08]|uniref:Hpt domain-containing protein n=1 Tax=Bradyrhizobium sp. NBAIM08 TaxID=2793815 RepID=UPI001CD22C51
MDDLLREFLTETSESLDTVDNQLVKFEQEPNNAKILDNIFRLVHTIKGTCGFLGLPRLEALAHAGETLMGKFRDGMPVTAEAVTVILSSIDRIKEILAGLEATEAEPEGNDRDLIDKLEAMVEQGMAAMAAGSSVADAPPLVPEAPAAAPAKAMTMGTLVDQTLERPLRPGEVSLDELERAFRETAIEAPAPVAQAEAKAEPAAEAPVAKEAAKPKEKAAPKKSMADEMAGEGDRIANQSIRVNVDTLEHLMTMVSELV